MTILAEGWKKRTGSNLSWVVEVSLNRRLSEINFEGNVADRRIGAKPVPDGWVMVRMSRKGRTCEAAVDSLKCAARHVGFVQDVVGTESWIASYCMPSLCDVNRTWVGGELREIDKVRAKGTDCQ